MNCRGTREKVKVGGQTWKMNSFPWGGGVRQDEDILYSKFQTNKWSRNKCFRMTWEKMVRDEAT